MGRLPDYDLTIDGTIAGVTTPFGLMLVKDPKKGIQYIDQRASVLNPNLSPDSVNYAAYPPDKDWPIAQTSFNAGFGKLVANAKYNNRYGESVGWDLRDDGNVQLFGSETAVTVNLVTALNTDFSNLDFESWTDVNTIDDWTKDVNLKTTREGTTKQGGTYSANLRFVQAPSITDGDFEAWDDASTLTNWSITAGTITRWADGPGGGSYYCELDQNTAAEIYQDVSWDSDMAGAEFTFTVANLYAAAADTARIGINDGVDTTWSSYNDGDSDFDEASVTKTLSSSATRLRLIVQRANNVNAVFMDGASTLTLTIVAKTIYQDIDDWYCAFNNKPITFTCYTYTNLANNLRIGISFDGGSTTTWSSYHTGGGTWEQLTTGAQTSDPGDTGIRLVVQRASTTDAADDFVDTAGFTQTAASRGTPIKFMKWGTDQYYLENKTIFKWDGSDSYDELYTLEDAIVDGVTYENRFIVSVGTGDFYYYSDVGDDSAWTRASADVSQKFGKMIVVKGVLWAAIASSQVANTTDVTGAATSGSSVGDSSVTITGMYEYNATLYVAKEDNIYVLTIDWDALTYTTETIAPRFKAISSTGNFTHGGVGDTLILGHNTGVLSYEYTDYGYADNISPLVYGSSFTDYHGACKAIAIGENWSYGVFEPASGNTKSKIMAVRREYIADAEKDVDWRWHPLGEVDLDEVYDASRHSDKLWIAGTKSSTAYIKSFTVRGTKTYPNCSGAGVAVHYQIDDDSSWTSLGTFDDSSGTETIAFAAGKNGYRIRFRISVASAAYYFTTSYFDGGLPGDLKSFRTFTLSGETLNATGTSQTPIVRSIILRCVLRTPPLRTLWCKVYCYDSMITKNGQDKILASVLKANLDSSSTETDPFTLYDIHGNSLTCVLVPPTPYESNITQDLIKDRVMSEIELILQEVRTS